MTMQKFLLSWSCNQSSCWRLYS